MPRLSERQRLLGDLTSTHLDFQLAHYQDLLRTVVDLINPSDDNSDMSDLDSNSSHDSTTSDVDTLLSLLATSDSSFTVPFTLHPLIIAFENTITVLTDKVKKSHYLSASQPAPHAPQLQLLEEWCINDDLPKFRHKLCVNPDVFACIIQRIKGHPVFSNNSNNPQLGVPIQFAIFLNGVGHYGNGATTEDLAEWVGVSTGTIYNCFRHVMITLLHFHDDVIHFDPMELEDQEERERAKEWVESHSCMGWRKGFLCVDGSPFNLFQKPGWHGEGFFDCKSRYSLSSQVHTMPHHNLDVLTI